MRLLWWGRRRGCRRRRRCGRRPLCRHSHLIRRRIHRVRCTRRGCRCQCQSRLCPRRRRMWSRRWRRTHRWRRRSRCRCRRRTLWLLDGPMGRCHRNLWTRLHHRNRHRLQWFRILVWAGRARAEAQNRAACKMLRCVHGRSGSGSPLVPEMRAPHGSAASPQTDVLASLTLFPGPPTSSSS